MKGIQIKLPVIKESKQLGKTIRRTYGEKKYCLDMSLAAEYRFEKKFPVECKSYGDLQQYTEAVTATFDNINRAKLASMLKCTYCFFDTDETFTEFLQMFDLTDIEYLSKLVDKLKLVFNIIKENAAEKN